MIKDYLKTQGQLLAHKFWVFWFILKFCGKLIKRGIVHDFSKFSNEEAMVFAKNQGKLGSTKYGTSEYKALLEEIRPAINHHYAKNTHHPEHWSNGIHDMSALDKIEMACDICAAVKRTKDGDVRYSIEKNQERFGYNGTDKKWFHSLTDEIERRKNPRRDLDTYSSQYDDVQFEVDKINKELEKSDSKYRIRIEVEEVSDGTME